MEFNLCSDVRKKAIRKVISDILLYSKKHFSKDVLMVLATYLSNYEVEKGVCVFMTPKRPDDSESSLIAKIDTGKDFLYLWWTLNANKNNKRRPKYYALGLTFEYKEGNDVAIYTARDWEEDFPAFSKYTTELKSVIWNIKVFSKASSFYKEIEDLPGEWLAQDPDDKDFAPNKPIGKIVGAGRIYIFQPNPKMNKEFYEQQIKII